MSIKHDSPLGIALGDTAAFLADIESRLAEGWGAWELDGCLLRCLTGRVFCWVRNETVISGLTGLSSSAVNDFTDAMRDIDMAVKLGLVERACACGERR